MSGPRNPLAQAGDILGHLQNILGAAQKTATVGEAVGRAIDRARGQLGVPVELAVLAIDQLLMGAFEGGPDAIYRLTVEREGRNYSVVAMVGAPRERHKKRAPAERVVLYVTENAQFARLVAGILQAWAEHGDAGEP